MAVRGGEVVGRIHTVSSAPVLDISENGALLEVATVLRPGSLYTLRLTLGPDRILALKSRVVRTYVHAFHPRKGGESVVSYRAAVEFLDVSEPDRTLLRQHMEDVQGALDLEFE